MPVTIKSNLVKIRDNPNAAYTSMDVISDSTTAERIQQITNAANTVQTQITSAANTAQTQIENKKNAALNSIPSDYTTLSNTVTAEVTAREAADLENQRRVLAAFPIETTNGEIAFASDGADNLPIKDIKVGINSVQDLHGYKYPWPAGGGKNLCNITLKSVTNATNGLTVTVNNNGSITLNGTTTINNAFFNINFVSRLQLTMPVNTPIKFGALVDKGSAVRIQLTTDGNPAVLATLPLTNAGFNISSDYTFSNDVTNNWLRIQVESANTQIDSVTIYPFWCLSSNPLTEWEPYSNICPISGWNSASITVTGKNYQPTVPAANVKGVLIQSNNNGGYNISGMFMFNADYAQQNAPRFHLEPGQYIITCKGATENYTYNFGKFIDGTWSQIANISNVNTGSATSVIFNVESADVEYMGRLRVHYTSNISKVNITNFYPMIQRIDKYKKYDINFPTAAGTVYGGTLTINEDGSGNLMVDKGLRTITQAQSVGTATFGNYAVIPTHVDCKEVGEGVYGQNLLCDIYKPVTRTSDRVPWCIYVINKAVVITNPNFTSVTAASAILTEQQPVLVYNLMNPIIYSLTAEQITTLIGENNISANTGNIIDFNYRANTDNIINKSLNSFPSDTVNGPIAHYIDGIDVPVKSLIATINPIQLGTGDPSVNNIRPINGWNKVVIAQTGANMLTHCRFDLPVTTNGITWSRSESGRIIANGTATAESAIGFNFVPDTEIIPQGTYIYGGCPNGGGGTTYNVYAFDYTDNKRPQREESDTQPSINVTNSTETASFYVPRGHAVRINLRVMAGVTVNNLIFAPFVVANNQNPTWSTPVNNIIPIVFPTQIGTIYGGKIDVLSGILTVTHKIYTFNGSEYWGSPQTGVRFETSLSLQDVISSWSSGGRGLSNIGVYTNNDKNVDVPYITSRSNIGTNGNVHTLVFPLNIASSVDEVKAFLAAHNEQWYAPLAYPIIYQLPPIAVKSYLGENNIFSDAGEVSVVYRADPSMYIDRKISEAIAALNTP